MNLNSLGDYYQEDPKLPQVVPVTTQDWAKMASLGMSSVRLIVSWSFLEPTRGSFDEAYVARIKAAVAQAKAHGIYVILDMHQDAWGKYIATPKGTVCPKGTTDNSGWDGAPKWATITDGASTCRPGARESAPAVQHAFNNFYANTDGIQDQFVDTWAKLAGAFADDPAVAGYDLINEPNVSGPVATIGPQYFAMLAHLITAIRKAESAASGGLHHIVFFEPLLDFPLTGNSPPPGFTTDTDIAFAPHNYWESITNGILTVAQGVAIDGSASKAWNVPYWIGEYGWWDTSAATVTHLHEFAAAQDAAFGSSDWWQWKQACGDPHGLSNREAVPPTSVVQLNTLGCPGDKDEGFTAPLAALVSRAYPREAPGYLTKLVSDYDARTLTVSGIASRASANSSPAS